MEKLLQEISKCTICSPYLELGPRPVLSAVESSKIIIIGQAPGKVVHKSGIPWDDQSGSNLREWLNVDKKHFIIRKKLHLFLWDFVTLERENLEIYDQEKNVLLSGTTAY